MKRVFTMLVIGGLMSLNAWAAKPTDMDGAKTPNGKVVVSFIDMLFNQHKGEDAFDNYVSREYTDHGNIGVTGTPPVQDPKLSVFERSRQGEAMLGKTNPKIHLDIKKVLVQGELVFVQAHGVDGQTANGDLMWMLYRVKDGKITEHWDTHNVIPDDQANKQW